jgi:hypothetical protein
MLHVIKSVCAMGGTGPSLMETPAEVAAVYSLPASARVDNSRSATIANRSHRFATHRRLGDN